MHNGLGGPNYTAQSHNLVQNTLEPDPESLNLNKSNICLQSSNIFKRTLFFSVMCSEAHIVISKASKEQIKYKTLKG